ncbi:MAG: RidA family protein [Flavobacteriales bacterium]
MSRTNISSNVPWESIVGYSRAVRIGNVIEVAGSTSIVDGTVAGQGDAAMQMRIILQKIESALRQVGASLSDVVRTRIYVTDISSWEIIGRVHGEFFKDIKPATTMVEVSRLIEPDMLVEVEATAIIQS